MPFSSCWTSLGLYPSIVSSDVFLSRRRVRKLKGLRRHFKLLSDLAYMDSSIDFIVSRDVR